MSEKSEDGTEVFPMDIAQKDVALLGSGGQLRNFGFFMQIILQTYAGKSPDPA